LLRRSKEHRFNPSLALTRFLIQRRPRGDTQRQIRAEAIAQTRLWWAFWQEHPAYFELAPAADCRRWNEAPVLDWLFKGSFWRCPPMQGEVLLLDVCHRLCVPVLEA
jgi:hypothetical protein